jgi:hypothetical protein
MTEQQVGEENDEPDDLMPAMSRFELPEVVRHRREEQAVRDEFDRGRYEKVVEAHVTSHVIALDFLAQSHEWVADNLDLDLVGDTRPAAVWQMAGRCIGIARLILDALSLGYCGEVIHLARALHEADRLLWMFTVPEGTVQLRRWLAGEYVSPKQARAAAAGFEERLAKAMRDAGIPELRRMNDLTLEIYKQHSEAAHHRRRWAQDAVSPQLRTMIRGRTTRWERRAGTVVAMLAMVEESVATVGDALGGFFAPGWYAQGVMPLLSSFEALREAKPLK